ncbi:hypothetical protein F511_15647 [Dorcoceras hygrometricum]|uniref:Uncharacterized protein n=1 Tax=Dorcoceras hygrometricum TaxID=472368 RepID=A0A2Z7B819_9LAMI|nr:hypothetical protein F511_15647 [Dorcoceras hygrometricum]
MAANRSQQGDESAVLPLALASCRKLCVSSRHGIQSQESRCSGELQSRRKIPVTVFEDSAEEQSSSRLESTAKQLTIYESWMSTAERNSNGINAQELIYSRSAIEEAAGWVKELLLHRREKLIEDNNRGKMNRKTKQSTSIREELSRESIAEF